MAKLINRVSNVAFGAKPGANRAADSISLPVNQSGCELIWPPSAGQVDGVHSVFGDTLGSTPIKRSVP
jgi:hypothetical protein